MSLRWTWHLFVICFVLCVCKCICFAYKLAYSKIDYGWGWVAWHMKFCIWQTLADQKNIIYILHNTRIHIWYVVCSTVIVVCIMLYFQLSCLNWTSINTYGPGTFRSSSFCNDWKSGTDKQLHNPRQQWVIDAPELFESATCSTVLSYDAWHYIWDLELNWNV